MVLPTCKLQAAGVLAILCERLAGGVTIVNLMATNENSPVAAGWPKDDCLITSPPRAGDGGVW